MFDDTIAGFFSVIENIYNKKQHLRWKKDNDDIARSRLCLQVAARGRQRQSSLAEMDTPFLRLLLLRNKPNTICLLWSGNCRTRKEIEQIVPTEADVEQTPICRIGLQRSGSFENTSIYIQHDCSQYSKELQDLQENRLCWSPFYNVSMNADLFKRVKAFGTKESQNIRRAECFVWKRLQELLFATVLCSMRQNKKS